MWPMKDSVPRVTVRLQEGLSRFFLVWATASKKLPLGRYKLVIFATNAAGQRSSPKSLSFTIVK